MSKKSYGSLSAPNVISVGIDVTKNNFKDLFILACIFIIIPTILLSLVSIAAAISFTTSIFGTSSNTLYYTGLGLGGFVILFILTLVVGVWTTAGTFSVIHLIHNRNLEGNNKWKQAMHYGFSKLGTSILYLLFSLLVGLIIGVGLLIIGFIGALIIGLISSLSSFLSIFLSIIGVIVLIILSIFLCMYIIFIPQCIVLYNLGIWDSFKLSVKMVNGRVCNVLLKLLLLGFLILIIALISTILNFIPILGTLLVTTITGILSVYEIVCLTLIFEDYDTVDNFKIDV